ncbi:MAG TPA: terminase small subunit [Acidobacteriaceae bacterium]|nr:terminase small subunit [Acidobacteriaceae bacterium]
MLTPKQKSFVAEYLANGLNATQAAKDAGYSVKTAKSIGQENLTKPDIAAAIAAETLERTARLGYTADRVLDMAGKMAFFDVRKMFESDGSPKQIHQLDDDTSAGIAGFEVIELFEGQGDQKHVYGLLKKVRLIDRRASVDMLMRHHSLYNDKIEHKGEIGIKSILVPDRIATKPSKRDRKPEFA